MSSVTSGADRKRRRRRLTTSIKESLRELSVQLAQLNRQVGARVELRDGDLECLDMVNRHGAMSPSAPARRAGLHPATMTGVLDRLERGGWISRERDPADRRAVVVRAVRDRNAEMFRLYSGMNSSMDRLCAGYSDAQLQLLADFLSRTTDAGRAASRAATDDLAAGGS